MKRLPSLRALEVFDSTARHMSFSRAADEMGVSQGAVSTLIKRLESDLGVSLLARTTRKMSLTGEGAALAQTCRRAFGSLRHAVDHIRDRTYSTVLTIGASTYFTTRWLSPRMAQFSTKHPEVTIQFRHAVNDEAFNFGEVDLGIRWGAGDWPGTTCLPWLMMPKRVFCSPALVARLGGSLRVRDLARVTLLKDREGVDLWDRWLDLVEDCDRGRLTSRVLQDPLVRLQAAIDGQGLILADRLVDPELATRRLVEPFPDLAVRGYGYFLVRSVHEPESDPARAFRLWLQSVAGSEGEILRCLVPSCDGLD